MKRILSAAIVFLAASLSAQVQIGRNVQIGGASGGGSGTVTSVSTAGFPSPFGTVVITNPTTTPIFTFTAPTYSQNQFLAGPTSGSGNPTARAIVPGDIPTLNQNTTGTASNLSGTPALPNGTTATTQSPGDNTTKLATDAFVLANAGSGAVSSVSNSDSSLTVTPTTGAVVASINPAHANTWTAPQTFAGSGPPISIPANKATSPSAGTGQFGTDASGNLVSSDNNAAQARVCNATNGVCSGASFPSGNVGQILSNTTGSTTYAAQGQLVYQQSGDTIASIEANAQCATACTYVVTGPQTLTLTGNHTMAAPVRIRFEAGGLWTVNGAFTLTFSSTPTSSSLTQHFSGSSTLAGLTGAVPFEWFGVLGFSTRALAVSGSDYTTQGQKCLDSLLAGWCQLAIGYYNFTTGLAITRGQIGIQGVQGRDAYNGSAGFDAHVSAIIQNSALGVMVSAIGGSTSATLEANTFKHFALIRTIQPTGTSAIAATGLYLQFTGSTAVEDVWSDDNLDGFYLNSVSGHGTGYLTSTGCQTSLIGIDSYVSGQNINCYDLDSSNGFAENTIFINRGTLAVQGTSACSTGVISTGWNIHGTHINDIDLLYPASAGGVCKGVSAVYSGSGGADEEADIHIVQPVLEADVSSVYISGLSNIAGFPSISIDSGYLTAVASSGTKIVDCENSKGVQITGNMLIGAGGSAIGVYENGCSGSIVSANKFTNTMFTGLIFIGTTDSTVVGNSFSLTTTSSTNVSLTSTSVHNTVTANSAILAASSTGYSFDGTSLANEVVADTCSTLTNCTSGTPTGFAPSFLGTGSTVNGVLIGTSSSYPQITSANNGTTGNNFTALEFMSGSGIVPCYAGQLAGQQWLDGCNGTYAGGSAPIYTVASSAQLHRLYPCAISATVSSCEETQLAPLGTIGANIPTTSVSFWGQWDPINSVHQTWIDPQAESPTFPTGKVFCANPSCNLSWDALGNQTALSGAFTTATVGGQNVCVANGTNCLFFLSNSSWNIQSALFATVTMLGAVHNTPYLNSLNASITVRTSGAISCTVAPVVNLMDLGTSATTVYGSATSIGSVTTATSDGVFTGTSSSALQNGHYYGIGFSAGTCITAPTFDISVQAVW